ncbi:hypothetical protein RHGRI_002922 [Rhododendron griersonianum]|uniref:Uncharacterized protein n=1 Tax=Rhododendron griersonianum TaxID=479676 RepID=A0AAV6LRI4_9ERIC|nr:hypothetical protein RHGRI_002922 [Rhododendron griersonianum]
MRNSPGPARVPSLLTNTHSRRIVDVLDGVQRRRCSGGVSVPKMPSLEALGLFGFTAYGELSVGYASGAAEVSGGSHPLRP